MPSRLKKLTTLADLVLDVRNANTGTERGLSVLERSLRETGAGRSILVDKAGRVICGNKTLEQWAALAEDAQIQVVQTNGEALVVVQRQDLDLTDPQSVARKLAYYDNRTSELDLAWNAAEVYQDLQGGLDLSTMFTEKELATVLASLHTPDTSLGAMPGLDATPPADLMTCPKCGFEFAHDTP